MAEALTLRANQVAVIEEVRMCFTPEPLQPDDPPGEGHQRVLLVAPTGFGKTTCFTYIAFHAWQKGSRTVIFVHRDELITQVCERLDKYGIPYGVMAAGQHIKPWEVIQVASVQTYVRRLKHVDPPEFMIFDEAHHCVAPTYIKIMDSAPGAHILGVTATPHLLSGKGMADAGYTRLVMADQISKCIAEGYLVPARVYAVPSTLDLGKLKTRGGEYDVATAEAEVIEAKITGSAVEQYKKLCPGTTAVAFCVSVKLALECAEEFNQAGVPAACIDGEMRKEERRELIRKFSSGEILVLTNCALVTEGFDLPRIQTVILLRPSKSLAYYMQCVGRAMRADEGKQYCNILDHVKMIAQPGFGFPDAHREWSLIGKSKLIEDETKKRKQCLQCYLWNVFNASKCENCGASFAAGGSATRTVTKADGQLMLVDDPSLIIVPSKAKELARLIGKARTYEDFQKIAQERDYSPGWARMAWKRRQEKMRKTKR